jgi:hypothetical protein
MKKLLTCVSFCVLMLTGSAEFEETSMVGVGN